jgi:NADPH2:quinone reductase
MAARPTGAQAPRVLALTEGAGVERIVEVAFGGNLDVAQRVIAAYASGAEPGPALPFYPLMFKAVTLRMVLVYLLPARAGQR